MNLNDLLRLQQIDPHYVLVLRHSPKEAKLRETLPWLAAENSAVFNAYQQTQGEILEKVMKGLIHEGYVAAFIGHAAKKALFVGLYSIAGARPLTDQAYIQIPENVELAKYGVKPFTPTHNRTSILWFDLQLTQFYNSWKGKLIVEWPKPEVRWWRWAYSSTMPVSAILEDNILIPPMPPWEKFCLTWEKLHQIPILWKTILSQWRGIYYIFDTSDGKGYVGSAYGSQNLLGRWQNYADFGDGGNKLLVQRNPINFHFSILQLVAPDMPQKDIIKIEATWKERLHTRHPNGLNAN